LRAHPCPTCVSLLHACNCDRIPCFYLYNSNFLLISCAGSASPSEQGIAPVLCRPRRVTCGQDADLDGSWLFNSVHIRLSNSRSTSWSCWLTNNVRACACLRTNLADPDIVCHCRTFVEVVGVVRPDGSVEASKLISFGDSFGALAFPCRSCWRFRDFYYVPGSGHHI
jgi:hypothetical protein